jgi:hypothetical protein
VGIAPSIVKAGRWLVPDKKALPKGFKKFFASCEKCQYPSLSITKRNDYAI